MAIENYRNNSGLIIAAVIAIVALMGLGLYVNNEPATSAAQSPSQLTTTIRP